MGQHHSNELKVTSSGPFSNDEIAALMQIYQQLDFANPTCFIDLMHRMTPTIPKHASIDQFLRGINYHFQLQAHENPTHKLQFQQFLDEIAKCLRSSSKSATQILFLAATQSKDQMTAKELLQLIDALFTIATEMAPEQSHHLPSTALDREFPAADSVIGKNDFRQWCSKQAPLLHTIMHSYFSRAFFPQTIAPKPTFTTPKMIPQASEILSTGQVAFLALNRKSLQRNWQRLYTSTNDGLSFNRLSHHILGYNGPTVVVCEDYDNAVFGMYCDTEWKDANQSYGGNDCFLFRVKPTVSIYSSKPTGEQQFMYLNSKGVALPRGFGMGGGSVNDFRLFFDEDFDNCTSKASCPSFESGSIAGSKQFQISVLEVWGCGDDAAAEAQSTFRDHNAKLLNQARKVDKAQFIGSDFDREMFFGKTFGHQSDAQRIADDEH